ncbi:MAG TPA: NfeD family protein [Thermoplasmata archaeon]
MPELTLLDRIFLYGVRSILIVLALVAFGSFLVAHGVLAGRIDYVASGAIIIVLGVGLAIAFMKTETKIIEKRYYTPETLVGQTARADLDFKANARGVVHIEHETWSAVSDEDIARGEIVVVTGVEPDKVTVRVRKAKT